MTCHHKRKGIVSNQQWTNDLDRPMMFVTCCDRDQCIRSICGQVTKQTGERATYLSDRDRWADPRWLARYPDWPLTG